jgi:hypothetical protein
MFMQTQNMMPSGAFPGGVGAGLPSMAGLSPIEKHMLKAIKAIREGFYPDPHLLASEFLLMLRRQDRTPSQLTKIGNGMSIVTENSVTPDTSKNIDPVSFADGMVHFLHLTAQHRPDSLHDVLAWWHAVQEDRTMCPAAKVSFAKDFMYTYKGLGCWVDLMKANPLMAVGSQQDAVYKGLHLAKRCEACFKRKRADDRVGGGKEHKKEVVKKEKKTPPGQPGPSRPAFTGVCYSRSDPSSDGCHFANCRFSHACASCGLDHMAKDCPAFDPSKIKRRR